MEPGVGDLPNVFCYDVDDLRHLVEANRREREREAVRAEALVEGEVTKWMAGLRTLDVVPTIVSLRRRLATMRDAEVAKALTRMPGASPETRRAIEALSSAPINKVLHTPTVELRELAPRDAGTTGSPWCS